MPNRLLTVRYNSQDYLIHVFYTDEKLEIKLFDAPANVFPSSKFSIDSKGDLTSDCSYSENVQPLVDLYEQIMQQYANLVPARILL